MVAVFIPQIWPVVREFEVDRNRPGQSGRYGSGKHLMQLRLILLALGGRERRRPAYPNAYHPRLSAR